MSTGIYGYWPNGQFMEIVNYRPGDMAYRTIIARPLSAEEINEVAALRAAGVSDSRILEIRRAQESRDHREDVGDMAAPADLDPKPLKVPGPPRSDDKPHTMLANGPDHTAYAVDFDRLEKTHYVQIVERCLGIGFASGVAAEREELRDLAAAVMRAQDMSVLLLEHLQGGQSKEMST